MSRDYPVVGGTKWTQDGIEPAKAFWIEAQAYHEELSKKILELPLDLKTREELLRLTTGQANALMGLRAALYELEVIGIQAKKDRLDNG